MLGAEPSMQNLVLHQRACGFQEDFWKEQLSAEQRQGCQKTGPDLISLENPEFRVAAFSGLNPLSVTEDWGSLWIPLQLRESAGPSIS